MSITSDSSHDESSAAAKHGEKNVIKKLMGYGKKMFTPKLSKKRKSDSFDERMSIDSDIDEITFSNRNSKDFDLLFKSIDKDDHPTEHIYEDVYEKIYAEEYMTKKEPTKDKSDSKSVKITINDINDVKEEKTVKAKSSEPDTEILESKPLMEQHKPQTINNPAAAIKNIPKADKVQENKSEKENIVEVEKELPKEFETPSESGTKPDTFKKGFMNAFKSLTKKAETEKEPKPDNNKSNEKEIKEEAKDDFKNTITLKDEKKIDNESKEKVTMDKSATKINILNDVPKDVKISQVKVEPPPSMTTNTSADSPDKNKPTVKKSPLNPNTTSQQSSTLNTLSLAPTKSLVKDSTPPPSLSAKSAHPSVNEKPPLPKTVSNASSTKANSSTLVPPKPNSTSEIRPTEQSVAANNLSINSPTEKSLSANNASLKSPIENPSVASKPPLSPSVEKSSSMTRVRGSFVLSRDMSMPEVTVAGENEDEVTIFKVDTKQFYLVVGLLYKSLNKVSKLVMIYYLLVI